MRPPWEDEILYTLPGINWAHGKGFCIPQLTGLAGSEHSWRWHMPIYPMMLAPWFKCAGVSLLTARLPSILASTIMAMFLSLICHSLAGFRVRWIFLLWMPLIFTDKSIIINAVIGRMEPFALLFILLSAVLAHRSTSLTLTGGSGFALGIALGFHPLALFFLPGCTILLLRQKLSVRQNAVRILFFFTGLSIPIIAYAAWFLSNWTATHTQFLLAARLAGSGSILHKIRLIFLGTAGNFRFQPFLIPSAVFGLLLLVWNCARRRCTNYPLAISITVTWIFYSLFLLRGSSNHYNYYLPLAALAYITLASVLPYFRETKIPRTVALIILSLLLANNALFAALKSVVVFENMKTEAGLGCFEKTLDQLIPASDKVVLPPNLWLYAKTRNLEWRVSYATLTGSHADPSSHTSYLETLRLWNPKLIVMDDRCSPPYRPSFTEAELSTSGYCIITQLNLVFWQRPNYDGWRLKFYTKKPTTPE